MEARNEIATQDNNLDSPDSFETAHDENEDSSWELSIQASEIPTQQQIEISKGKSQAENQLVVTLQNKLNRIVKDRSQRRALALKLESECWELREKSIRAHTTAESLVSERDTLLMENHDVVQENEALNEECILLQKQLNEMKEKFAAAEASLNTCNSKVKVEKVQKATGIPEEKYERVVNERDEALKDARKYAERLADLVENVEKDRTQQKKTIAECQRLKEKCTQLLAHHKKQESLRKEEQSSLSTTIEQLKKHNSALEAKEAIGIELSKENETLKQKVSESEAELSDVQKELEVLKCSAERAECLQLQHTQQSEQFENLKSENQNIRSRNAELEIQTKELLIKFQHAKSEADKVDALRLKNSELEMQIRVLNSSQQEFETFKQKNQELQDEVLKGYKVVLERDQLSRQVAALESELKQLPKLRDKLNSLEETQISTKQLKVELESLKGKADKLRKLEVKFATLQEQHEEVKSNLDKAQKKLVDRNTKLSNKENGHNEQIKSLEQQVDKEKAKAATLRNVVEDLKDKRASDSREIDRVSRQLQEKNSTIETLHRKVKTLESPESRMDPETKLKIVTLQQAVEQSKREFAILEKSSKLQSIEYDGKISSLSDKLDTSSKHVKEYKAKLEASQKEIKEMQNTHDERTKELKRTQDDQNTAIKKLKKEGKATELKLSKSIQSLSLELEHREGVLETQRKLVSELQIELKVQRSTKCHLEKDIALINDFVDGAAMAFSVHKEHPDTMTVYQRIVQISGQVANDLLLQQSVSENEATLNSVDGDPKPADAWDETSSLGSFARQLDSDPKLSSVQEKKVAHSKRPTVPQGGEQSTSIPMGPLLHTEIVKRFSFADLEAAMYRFPQLTEPLLVLDFGGVFNTATLTRSHLLEEIRVIAQEMNLSFQSSALDLEQVSLLLACATMNAMRTSAGQMRSGDESQMIKSLSKFGTKRGARPNLAYLVVSQHRTVGHPDSWKSSHGPRNHGSHIETRAVHQVPPGSHAIGHSSRLSQSKGSTMHAEELAFGEWDLEREKQTNSQFGSNEPKNSRRLAYSSGERLFTSDLDGSFGGLSAREQGSNGRLAQGNGRRLLSDYDSQQLGHNNTNPQNAPSRERNLGTVHHRHRHEPDNKLRQLLQVEAARNPLHRPSNLPPSPHSPFNRHLSESSKVQEPEWKSTSSSSPGSDSESSPGADDETESVDGTRESVQLQPGVQSKVHGRTGVVVPANDAVDPKTTSYAGNSYSSPPHGDGWEDQTMEQLEEPTFSANPFTPLAKRTGQRNRESTSDESQLMMQSHRIGAKKDVDSLYQAGLIETSGTQKQLFQSEACSLDQEHKTQTPYVTKSYPASTQQRPYWMEDLSEVQYERRRPTTSDSFGSSIGSTKLRIFPNGIVDVSLRDSGADAEVQFALDSSQPSRSKGGLVPKLYSELMKEFEVANNIQTEIDRYFN